MCQADLPLEMISALLAFGRAVTEHVSAQRDGSLDDHERGVLEALFMRAIIPERYRERGPCARSSSRTCNPTGPIPSEGGSCATRSTR